MEIRRVNLVYFSATNTTQRVVRAIAQGMEGDSVVEYNVTNNDGVEDEIRLHADDLLIVGVPVYSGRVPAVSVASINRFRSEAGTPAIVVCLYGNRDYDDALLELKDLVSDNGFRVVAAGVFVGTHSIFPDVAVGRPSDVDLVQAANFGQAVWRQLSAVASVDQLSAIEVKGDRPYRQTKKIPLYPTANKECDRCGVCSKLCPVEAIDCDNPRKTDKAQCIACGRCIVRCPEGARSFKGILYSIAKKRFVKANSDRKPNELILAN